MTNTLRIVIVVGLAMVIGVVLALKDNGTSEVETSVVAYEQASRKEVSPSERASQEESPQEVLPVKRLPRLVDLGADKCIPCKRMAPILEELKHKYVGKLTVDFIDVWKYPEQAREYGVRIIPTQIFFDAAGVERFRHEGEMSKAGILDKWKELGVDLSSAQ